MNPNNPTPDLKQKRFGTCGSCNEYLSYQDVLNIDPILDNGLLCGYCKNRNIIITKTMNNTTKTYHITFYPDPMYVGLLTCYNIEATSMELALKSHLAKFPENEPLYIHCHGVVTNSIKIDSNGI